MTDQKKQIKERPILFSGPMVRAIIEGWKTQTRRVIKSHPNLLNYSAEQVIIDGVWHPTSPSGKIGLVSAIKCPYGKPGERLWVRETWQHFDVSGVYQGHVYRADDEGSDIKWKSSIFMPRSASRLLLEITDVRVERLQDISDSDAIAEGVQGAPGGHWIDYRKGAVKYGCVSAHESFETLWQSINGTESLAENPWVWVVEFKRV